MGEIRLATPDDAGDIAALLHDFNTEFDTATPPAHVLAPRLATMLSDTQAFALLGGSPPVAVALVSVRPNVWYDGPVALLDELYVAPTERNRGIGSRIMEMLEATSRARGIAAIEINVDEHDVDAQRFYERHGFSATEPGSDERAYFYFRELRPDGV